MEKLSSKYYRPLAVVGYFGLVVGLAALVWIAASSLYDRYAELSAANDQLDAMEGRGKVPQQARAGGPSASGSPFLEGQTVTVAGAALQQRVGAAVKAVGGNVLSSQIDLQGPESKKGYVNLTVSCEVDQPGLQQLLYDLEAGMPFLFIDQLVVQAPQSLDETEGGRLRILVGLSGQWQGAK
jgi:general secretion pathway protein M